MGWRLEESGNTGAIINICLPVSIKGRQGHGGERVIIRFPLSYKLGEDVFPDNAIEKLRSEAAT